MFEEEKLFPIEDKELLSFSNLFISSMLKVFKAFDNPLKLNAIASVLIACEICPIDFTAVLNAPPIVSKIFPNPSPNFPNFEKDC